MYGLPGQTPDIQQHDLETAVSLDVQHISSYCLSYEEDSPLDRLRKEGRVTPTDDDTCARMYDRLCACLGNAGFIHYEISNFSKPGFHSRHNSSYWDGTPYLGIGAGAHSYNGLTRQWNPSDLDAYMTGIEHGAPFLESESLSATDQYNERIMLSLRTAQGLNLSLLNPQDRLSVLQSAHALISDGLLLHDDNCIRIPEQHMFISDSIISSLFK
jgi:oxygen-independent coproporphyrinogen-3 oxidase